MPKETNLKAENRDFFAAANSGRGFISFYNEIFNCERIERRYLIKKTAVVLVLPSPNI